MKHKFKILHLEDSATDAELAARELRKSHIHFEHLVIDTEAEYIDALEHFKPDLILCDHSLPSFNSREALQIKRMRHLHIPFILITATMTDEVALGLVRDGADDYILKDSIKRLPHAVHNALEKYGRERERRLLLDRVTEKEAESQEALKQLTTKLLLANKASALGIWDYFVEEGKIICDDYLLSLYGLEQGDFDGTFNSWMNLIDSEDRPRVKQEVKWAWQNKTDLDTEFRVVCSAKSVQYIRSQGIIEFDALGKPYRMIGTNQDITERKLSAKAIQESEAFSQGILNSLSSHIAVVNGEGIVIKVNQSWRVFAENNQPLQEFQYNEGADYFKACETSNDPEALLTLKKVKEVLSGTRENLYLEYPCHAPNIKRWFYMRVKLFESSGLPMLLIEHQYITERKLAEEKLLFTSQALQQTLNDLNKIMDSSLDVICTIDKEGRFSKVSAASKNVWGFLPEELVGRKYMDFVYPEDITSTNEVAALIIQGIDFTSFENRYVRKDGTVVPIMWSASWDEGDKTMHCIAKDATDIKRLEAAFESERERFVEMFKSAPSSIGICNGPDHVFIMANERYLQLTGRQNIVGKSVREVFPEIADQGLFESLDAVYNTGVPFVANERLIKLDKNSDGILQDVYLNFVYQAYRNRSNDIEGIFFFAIDVTEQVVSRKKIEESEKNYSLLFHNSPLSQFICDKNSLQFIEVNAAALNQYGYTREEFLGLTPTELQHADDYKASNELWRETGHPHSLSNNLLYHRNKNGDKLIVEIKTSEIIYHGALCLLTTLSDLTQEIRLQEKMAGLKVKAQKKVTQAHIKGQERERAYIGRELHDNINQQLTTAKLYLDLAKDREDMRLSLVQKSEGLIQKTINEIRNLSKAFMLPTQEELNLQDTLRELISTYSQFENLKFHLRTHECLSSIDGELKLMFYRIIQEQLNNIVKYAACQNVWIEFELFDESIYLLIKDDGKGFDVHATRKGIGLSNIKGRLELHNGELDIVSAPGEGCAVHILVPLENEVVENDLAAL
ncbi:MAG: domain S-box [Flaviaesturariibacter sp.]|nr:domain S-box [Flaviaesturariibacter sp.]